MIDCRIPVPDEKTFTSSVKQVSAAMKILSSGYQTRNCDDANLLAEPDDLVDG
jgi:hypothetical protein